MKYDFIEIGSSDIETLLEERDGEIGLTIEPVGVYLHRLPDKPGVTKVCCAIGDRDGKDTIFYVHPDNIEKFNLPNWLKGCNSIGSVHPTTRDILRERDLEYLMEIDSVKMITWDTLVRLYFIESVEYVKIDAEGFDTIIVQNILSSHSRIYPKILSFEVNWLFPNTEKLNSVIENLHRLGYKERSTLTPDKPDSGEIFFERNI